MGGVKREREDGMMRNDENNKSEEVTMKLEEAKVIAERVKQALTPYCDRIEIAGSIRRGKPIVHDIDIVLIEKPGAVLVMNSILNSVGEIELNGSKIKRLRYGKDDISIDIYIATPATWATLLLIRTGSKENNIRLCSLAKRKGWQLKANGDGLFDENGKRIAGDTEESIYKALGNPYQEPQHRT